MKISDPQPDPEGRQRATRRHGKLLLGLGLFVLIFGYFMFQAAIGWTPALWMDAVIVAILAGGLYWALGRLGFDPYGGVENQSPNPTEQK